MSDQPANIPQQDSVGKTRKTASAGLKICCSSCLVLFLVALIGIGLIWRGLGGKDGPKIVDELPANFPSEIKLYQLEKADQIEYFSGQDKNKFFNSVLLPLKFFGSIMVYKNQNRGSTTSSMEILERVMDANASRLQQIDTVTVRWVRLPGSKTEVYKFYSDQFKRNGFTAQAGRDDATSSDILIAVREDGLLVQLQIQDVPDIANIDMITIKVDYSNQ